MPFTAPSDRDRWQLIETTRFGGSFLFTRTKKAPLVSGTFLRLYFDGDSVFEPEPGGPVVARPESYDKKVALVPQGGGALGSYQAGVYEALSTSQYLPDWIAGISIGAINAAIIAGNAPDKRVERLTAFWEGITSPSSLPPILSGTR
jgi:hypothetical protein